jgi:hypothetical protein|nr:MAG TPA: HeH/LEM domain [Herelleviridae sp.]
MSKIFNEALASAKLTTSLGEVEFDNNGVADVEDEEFVAGLLKLKGFTLADGNMPNAVEDSVEEVEQENEEEPAAVESDEDAGEELSEEVLNGKNIMQLKKIAKDNNIELSGANKKDEIISIILAANAQ